MIELDQDIPPAVLADAPAETLEQALRDAGGTWLRGRAEAFGRTPEGQLAEWRSATDGHRAVPTGPSVGQLATVIDDDTAGLLCRSSVHGGMVVDHVAPGNGFSMAVIWYPHPSQPARTLLCLNPSERDGGAYLFLSQGEDGITVKDTGEMVVLNAPDIQPNPAAAQLIVLSVARTGIALSRNGGEIQRAGGSLPPFPASTSLFIGCRSHRKGLLKTLGASLIRDVVFLPGRQLLEDPAGAEMQALLRYFRWSC